MNSTMAMPTEVQLHWHQHMLFQQQQVTFCRHVHEEVSSQPTLPFLGGGPPLPPEVKLELQNRELWMQFHGETTEMVITKVGRRMFPSIQLIITGLERRSRYSIVLEMEPASDRRHKYVSGSGENTAREWISAGPAEPQPPLDRRIYMHPDSPATGAHWMQHPLSFSKLKLTNNAAGLRTNVVLTSMHKYIPRIWIVRCDDISRLSELYAHPATSFRFNETEFIAVTAYQNENITKLKIDNNPFAKGFRETGQSRCKRKFQAEAERCDRSTNDEDDENASFETDSNKSSGPLEQVSRRPRTASSDAGSLDDSGVSSCGGITPPLPSAGSQNSSFREAERDPQPRLHRPWIDSCSETATMTMTSTSMSFSGLLPSFGCFNFPSRCFRMHQPPLLPPFGMQPDFSRMPCHQHQHHQQLHHQHHRHHHHHPNCQLAKFH